MHKYTVLIVTHNRNSLSYLSADLDRTIAIISHVLFINVLTLIPPLYIYIYIYIQIYPIPNLPPHESVLLPKPLLNHTVAVGLLSAPVPAVSAELPHVHVTIGPAILTSATHLIGGVLSVVAGVVLARIYAVAVPLVVYILATVDGAGGVAVRAMAIHQVVCVLPLVHSAIRVSVEMVVVVGKGVSECIVDTHAHARTDKKSHNRGTYLNTP